MQAFSHNLTTSIESIWLSIRVTPIGVFVISKLFTDYEGKTEPVIPFGKQIVNHLIFWNERYLNRFKGVEVTGEEINNDVTFESGSLNGTVEEWQSTVSRLNSVMSEWTEAVKNCNPDKLHTSIVKDSDEPWSAAIANINIHNAYHTGQILEIRKTEGIWDPKNGVH
ncbi:DinB family protein [Chengkuizengella axinellae]|uniref:DinB family protein n=1 Tax=Chengkuizengella axinellae TaxID=3064388 RepID=A0ABT9J302_9BACL|nr:DinB family protein [Chengkuizengella sp. 2205SS18-9]MDP5275989.1 DinB family protein [Chengkuizengella sp. 2205SS18-9]